MSYIPTTKSLPVNNIINNTSKLIRDLKLKSFFSDSIDRKHVKFVEKSDWIPSSKKLESNVLNLCDRINSTVFETLKEAIDHSDGNGKCKKAIEQLLEKNTQSQDNSKFIYQLGNLTINLEEKNNTNQIEIDSIKSLKNNKDIIIKPADKGGATVLMDRKCYINEALRQLQNTNYYKIH